MATKRTKGKTDTHRKLTAVLCADVVGYSRSGVNRTFAQTLVEETHNEHRGAAPFG